MGFVMPFSNTELAFACALLAILLLLVWNVRLEQRVHRLTVGGKPKTLDQTLEYLKGKTDDYESFRADMESYLTGVENRLRQSVQGVGAVRFNPFRGSGSSGNQSFAIAFLNQNGNGLIISSIYARDHVSIFAKPVLKFASEFELTAEEKEAMQKAKSDLHA